jgi:hypothetical protein
VQLSGLTAAAETSAASATSAHATLSTPYQMRSATTGRFSACSWFLVGATDILPRERIIG